MPGALQHLRTNSSSANGKEVHMRPMILKNGNVLRNGQMSKGDVCIKDGKIADQLDDNVADCLVINATDLHVLPGIVDVHGDAFERQIMPRSGVSFDLPLAMQDTDMQLAANGITTAFHGLTISWEPGLRSVENASRFMDAMRQLRTSFSVDHRVQLRWETFALDAVTDVAEWLLESPRPSLAFNDHTTSTIKRVEAGNLKKLAGWASRCNLTPEEYIQMVYDMSARMDEVPEAIETLAKTARDHDVAILSHDDVTAKDRTFYRALGATISEFPMTHEALVEAKSASEHTVFGAPNVVRGGSHNGALCASEMVQEGLCTILASDYHYPSMLQAAFKLVRDSDISLPDAWALVSSNPAEAMGLNDRGSLEIGNRADVIIVDAKRKFPRTVVTISGGKVSYLSHTEIL